MLIGESLKTDAHWGVPKHMLIGGSLKHMLIAHWGIPKTYAHCWVLKSWCSLWGPLKSDAHCEVPIKQMLKI